MASISGIHKVGLLLMLNPFRLVSSAIAFPSLWSQRVSLRPLFWLSELRPLVSEFVLLLG